MSKYITKHHTNILKIIVEAIGKRDGYDLSKCSRHILDEIKKPHY